jgi:hypothetical protein
MGRAVNLFSQAEPDLLRILLGRLRDIVRQSNSVFLFLTATQKNDPFSSLNYPVGFPLSELADVRVWLQDESWTHQDGLATAYKASLTVIKNNLASAGKGANIRITFSNPPASDVSPILTGNKYI